MNKKQIVEKLVKIANDLDVLDLSKESDQLTKVAEKVLLAEIEYSPDFNPDYEADTLTNRLVKISQNNQVDSFEEFDLILDSINKLIAKGVLTQQQLRSIQNILFSS